MTSNAVSKQTNILMCRQWWKVCWMYGDQEKYYRQLYAKRATSTPIVSLGNQKPKEEPRTYENQDVNNDSTWLAITQQRFDE